MGDRAHRNKAANLGNSADDHATTATVHGTGGLGGTVTPIEAPNGRTLAAADTPQPSQDTPEQQAAVQHWMNDAKRVFIQAYRRYGRIGYAAEQAKVDRTTGHYWLNHDPEVADAIRDAGLNLTDELAVKGVTALLNASDEQLLLHPNLYFHEMNYREPGRRPNAAVQITNQSLTVNTLDASTAQAIGRLLAGYEEGEELA